VVAMPVARQAVSTAEARATRRDREKRCGDKPCVQSGVKRDARIDAWYVAAMAAH